MSWEGWDAESGLRILSGLLQAAEAGSLGSDGARPRAHSIVLR